MSTLPSAAARAIVIAFVVAGTLAHGAAASASAGQPASAVPWKACPKTLAFGQVTTPPDMQCAQVAAPLDAARPSGPQVHLAVGRLPALDPARRIGSLFIQPGGPGLPAVAELAAAGTTRFPTLRSRFDLVSVDPRGIGPIEGGMSTPSIDCGGAPPPDVAPNGFVHSLVDFERVTAANRAFVERCEAGSDDLLAHLGSTSDARDLEAVRRALGEDRISLYGNSGGTPIMQRYAELYPAHVRALYLDSVLDYGAGEWARRRAFADTYEAAFQAFAAWCRGDGRCALHGQDPVRAWEQVAAAADRQLIPAPLVGGTVDGDVLRGAALVAVAVPSDWVQFGQGLAQAVGGDASWFAAFWPQLFQVSAFDQVVLAAQLDILCANGYSRVPSYAALNDEQREIRAEAPEVGWFSAVVGIGGDGPMSCQGFPPPVDPPRPVDWDGSFPVLVVNANVDNATPYALAAAEQRQIPHSVLLTLNRVHGHGAYLSNYSSCIDAAVERYLFELHLPASGTVCQPNQPVPGA